jgi:hypothetical protein
MNMNKTPKWILYFGIFLGAFGVIVGSIGVMKPVLFFNDFSDFTQWQDIAYITAGWGVRSLAAGVAMLVALRLGSPSAIATVFCMRFLTELGDLVNSISTGHGTLGLSLTSLSIFWVVAFLFPEAKAVHWGIKATLCKKRQELGGNVLKDGSN